jgi:hypothetical protein
VQALHFCLSCTRALSSAVLVPVRALRARTVNAKGARAELRMRIDHFSLAEFYFSALLKRFALKRNQLITGSTI